MVEMAYMGPSVMTEDAVRYPAMRAELIALLDDFISPDVAKEWRANSWHFFEAVNLLDDLLPSAEDSTIGFVLTTEKELRAVTALVREVHGLFPRYRDASFADVESDPAWTRIVRLAREARNAMSN